MDWKRCKVLVTGADGFIGSHLVERLAAIGADVRAFCFYNSNGSWGWLDESEPQIKKKLEVRLGDIRDIRFVEKACQGIDIIFHLAALIAIPYSYEATESFIDTNVKGTLNILEGARLNGCRRIVHTSTSEVYGTPAIVPITETHQLQGKSPYSASKIAADKLCEAYYCSFNLPVVVLRPFNTYGPRQSPRAILPTILVQLLNNSKTVRLGRLDPKRDFTFISDTVEGFIKAGSVEGIEGEVIQLGTGQTYSIKEIFETVCQLLGRKAEVVQEMQRLRPENSEVQILLSDPSKAKKYLDWTAKISLADGLKQTMCWFEKRLGCYDQARYHI